MRVSLANRVTSASSIIAGIGDSAAGYPVANVATYYRPFKVWKSQNLTADQYIGFSWPDALSLNAVSVANTNLTSIHWLAGDGVTPGVYQHDSGVVAVTRNPWNGRMHSVYRPAATWTNVKALIMSIPAQSPAEAYFYAGGLWAGTITESPDGIAWDYQPKPNHPRKDTMLTGGARSRVSIGNTFASLTAKRVARINARPAGYNDTLAAWLELERQWVAQDYALVQIEDDPAQCMVMRIVDDESWDVGYGLAEAGLALEERIGP